MNRREMTKNILVIALHGFLIYFMIESAEYINNNPDGTMGYIGFLMVGYVHLVYIYYDMRNRIKKLEAAMNETVIGSEE